MSGCRATEEVGSVECRRATGTSTRARVGDEIVVRQRGRGHRPRRRNRRAAPSGRRGATCDRPNGRRTLYFPSQTGTLGI